MNEKTQRAKRWLESYRVLARKAEILMQDAQEAQDMATNISPGIKEVQVQTTRRTDGMASKIVSMIDKGMLAEEAMQAAERRFTAITKAIKNMRDTDEAYTLELRYLNAMDWEKIAYVMGKEVKTVYHYHGMALLHIEPIED